MGSSALADLLAGIAEVRALRGHVPRRESVPKSQRATWAAAQSANRRACVVLLCSHFERYIYGANEEATDYLNASGVPSERLPERLRLLQTRQVVDDLALQQWDSRASKLGDFSTRHSPMWQPGHPVLHLDAAATLAPMKSPKVKDVVRYFQALGIPHIFDEITRTEHHRRRLTRSLQALVDSRNGIAHGDATVQPLSAEVSEYSVAVRDFGTRVDRVLSRALGRLSGASAPW